MIFFLARLNTFVFNNTVYIYAEENTVVLFIYI